MSDCLAGEWVWNDGTSVEGEMGSDYYGYKISLEEWVKKCSR